MFAEQPSRRHYFQRRGVSGRGQDDITISDILSGGSKRTDNTELTELHEVFQHGLRWSGDRRAQAA